MQIDKTPPWKIFLASRVEGIRATIIVLVFTFLALFMDDFRLLVLPPSLDEVCEILSILVLVTPVPMPRMRCSCSSHLRLHQN